MLFLFVLYNKAVLKFETSQNEPKRAENKVMQPTPITNDLGPIFPYHFHSQAGFDKSFINGRDFIYLDILKMSYTFQVFTKVQGSV